ncbi:SDR family oxidoreductase [Lentzea sp. NPDC054927]
MIEAVMFDVVVVGAGPTGLLLAGDLCASGKSVVVLDQLAEPMTESRASTLHTRTMEILEERGVLDVLGPLPPGGPGHFGGLRLDLAEADPSHRFAGQWKCPQTTLEQVLGARAAEQGAQVRRGHVVTGLVQHADHVEVDVVALGGKPHRLRARWLAGCDGERSTVRQLAGFELTGTDATTELLRADVAGIDVANRRFERLPNGLATAHRWPDGTTRIMVSRNGLDDVAAAWRHVTGEDIGHGDPVWSDVFDDACRQATEYRRGRVLLAGDAAHVQMPVGGLALNLGLQDAAAMAENFDTYHDIRHPEGARVLTTIRAQSALLLGGQDTEALRAVLEELLQHGVVRRHLARSISGTSSSGNGERTTTMGRLTGKTALVTGSSRGIGRATAIRLAREGALVAVHYGHDETAAKETVTLIEKEGGAAFAVKAELGVPGDVHELFVALETGLKERIGEARLDVLVNNAGATSAQGTPPDELRPEEFDHLFAVNAKAPYFIVQRAVGLMPDGGRIINISSGLTRFANPDQIAYAMTKGAIEQISLHFARHLAPRGITVNSVAPGITNNGGPVFDIPEAVEQMAQLSAFKRVGDAGDVADVVTFLATDEARWITGSFVDATGGTLLG